jgi:hypothetical protein
MNNHRVENYLKNDLFEGIIGKMDYLTLYNADILQTIPYLTLL